MNYEDLPIYDKCLVHRYRYYVMNDPVISDHVYDTMEKVARQSAPKGHPILEVGSSLAGSYSEEIKRIAIDGINNH